MVALIQLRKKEPDLVRPFKVPFYPFTPLIALTIASIALIAIIIYNPILALVYLAIILMAFGWFKLMHADEPLSMGN